MNAPIPILYLHVGVMADEKENGHVFEQGELAFVRLAELLQDIGETLTKMSRLCGRPEIVSALMGLEGLHRGPGISDRDVIMDALRLLESLRENLMSIPADCEIVGDVFEADRMLIADLDAAVRYAGARVDDNIRALGHLL